MEEKMLSTIKKIKLLAEQDSEFRQEMQKLFGSTVSASVVDNNDDERISHIEKYLGLDYYVDSVESIIDYSFVKEQEVKNKLISDNREMLRFRFGTRSHMIDFEEFCRYAQLQAEMLLNYFYCQKGVSLSEITKHIKNFNPTAIIPESISNLSAISFSTKLWAFEKEFNLNVIETFDHVREVRNNQSHRNPKERIFSIEDYQRKLQDWKIVLKKDGTFDWFQTKQNTLAYNIFESKVKKSDEFKLYNYLLWFNKKPYDEVIDKLKIIASAIKENLSESTPLKNSVR